MKQCPNCLARNPGNAKFCKECGSSLEGVPDISRDLSAAASGLLNKAGNLLIEGSKKIGSTVPKESGSQEETAPVKAPMCTTPVGEGSGVDGSEVHPRPQNAWKDIGSKLLRQKHLWFAVFAAVVIIIAIAAFGGMKSKRLVGMWKMYPSQMPGYGINLDIDKNTIDARGDYVNYGGRMIFKYEVVSDSELILRYDWTFDQWPWGVAKVDKIPPLY